MSTPSLPGMEPLGEAVFSSCGQYRYVLRRHLGNAQRRVLWVMLNPSTATADEDDATIRRCVGYTVDWGYGALSAVNLFAYRSTDPKGLRDVADPIGSWNDEWIIRECRQAQLVVAAWGNEGALVERHRFVLDLLARNTLAPPQCLGVTKEGHPVHPLRQPRLAPLRPVPGYAEPAAAVTSTSSTAVGCRAARRGAPQPHGRPGHQSGGSSASRQGLAQGDGGRSASKTPEEEP